jgi:hypothetical protein
MRIDGHEYDLATRWIVAGGLNDRVVAIFKNVEAFP